MSKREKILYQTVAYEKVERIPIDGPFPCYRPNAWLGDGFYFWDTFIENAHWWGKIGYKENYVICQAECTFESGVNSFDLVGSTENMQELEGALILMKKFGYIKNDEPVTVRRIIKFMQETDGIIFDYQAIRAYGIGSKHYDIVNSNKILFNTKHSAYYEQQAPIQLCLFDKTSLELRNFRIIDCKGVES